MSSEKMSVKMGEAFVHGWRLRASRQATGGTGIHDFVYVHLKIMYGSLSGTAWAHEWILRVFLFIFGVLIIKLHPLRWQ